MSKIILCADDSVTMQKVAEITFRATEYSYVGAQNADDALAKARQGTPVLVLADASMPGKDGYDLCKAIKGDAALAGVPVVLLCGKSQAYDSDRGADVGADGHLTKPWDTQVMIDKVAEILAKAGSAGTAASRPAATPVAAPKVPSIPTQSPTTARSATIMGMPSIKPPMKSPSAPGVTPIQSIPSPAPVAPPKRALTPAPIAAKAPAPAPTPAPVAAKAPTPVKVPAPAPKPAAAPAASTIGRPPMIRGIPTKRLKPISAQVASKVAAAAADVAREAGLDPAGPEVQALMRLSADVIERIAWEVIPELAEAMIRENLQDLAAKQQ